MHVLQLNFSEFNYIEKGQNDSKKVARGSEFIEVSVWPFRSLVFEPKDFVWLLALSPFEVRNLNTLRRAKTTPKKSFGGQNLLRCRFGPSVLWFLNQKTLFGCWLFRPLRLAFGFVLLQI